MHSLAHGHCGCSELVPQRFGFGCSGSSLCTVPGLACVVLRRCDVGRPREGRISFSLECSIFRTVYTVSFCHKLQYTFVSYSDCSILQQLVATPVGCCVACLGCGHDVLVMCSGPTHLRPAINVASTRRHSPLSLDWLRSWV
jgi:hypothetical protein